MPGEIEARLGAAWIDASWIRDFLVEILDDAPSGSSIPAARSGPSAVTGTPSWPPPPGAPAATRPRSWPRRSWNSAASKSATRSATTPGS